MTRPKYRYSLWRIWDKEKPIFTFVGLNPSTADHVQDDPTITHCINFAKSWGGGIYMANLFAYRATDPQEMMSQDDPIGSDNDFYLNELSTNPKKSLLVGAIMGRISKDLLRLKNS